MHPVDVHILTLPERTHWLEECLVSLTNEPINIHLVGGVHHHVGKGRIQGFSQGTAEWVSFVDDDDLVLPGAFLAIESAIEEFPEARAVFTREELINDQGAVIKEARPIPDRFNKPHLFSLLRWDHHLMVFHRETLQPYLKDLEHFPMGCNAYLAKQFIKKYPCVMHPVVAYQWRIHADNWHTRAVKTVGNLSWPG